MKTVIIAHYYQRSEVQDIADFVGDSFAMAKYAASTDADTIVVAGVRFMAETVALLNPDKMVLLPEAEAGCSLAANCEAGAFRSFVEAHPDHAVVTYINSSVDVKALSDIVCTSSNAVSAIMSVPKDQPIIFAPDRNLGRWLQQVTGREMLLWDATCEVHQEFALDKIVALRDQHPGSKVLAHPECVDAILEIADVVGSTSVLLEEVLNHQHGTYIIATEEGILKSMRAAAPFATLIPAPQIRANECACGECRHMKLTTLVSIERALRTQSERIVIDEHLREEATKPLRRMMAL